MLLQLIPHLRDMFHSRHHVLLFEYLMRKNRCWIYRVCQIVGAVKNIYSSKPRFITGIGQGC